MSWSVQCHVNMRTHCGISILLANDLGAAVLEHGLVCYVTTDKLKGKGLSFSCSHARLDGRS